MYLFVLFAICLVNDGFLPIMLGGLPAVPVSSLSHSAPKPIQSKPNASADISGTAAVPAIVPPPVAVAAAPKTGGSMGSATATSVVEAFTHAGSDQAKAKSENANISAPIKSSSSSTLKTSESAASSAQAPTAVVPSTASSAPASVTATPSQSTINSTGSNSNASSAVVENSDPAAYVSPCGSWKGRTVESFQWLDLSPQAKDMYIDIKYTHDFKVRGPTYMSDKKKVQLFC